jgi:rod shape-determining protein MreC
MLKYLREYRFYVTLFLFLLVPLIAIDTTSRAPAQYRFFDKVILTVTSPIQGVVTWSLDRLVGVYQNYLYLLDTREENRELLAENRKLLGTIASLRETEQENLRLKRLLDFRESHKIESQVARVVGRDVSTEYRAIRINRGESSGVKPNMAVLTNEGIVGRVLRTTETTADVVTILDLLSAVDTIVERSRARGIVEGLTDDLCQLKYALRTDDITPGDVLVTSGLGGIFPKGIPVGTVSKVNRKTYGISQEVEVRPSVDFMKLEEVLIVTQTSAEYQPQIPATPPAGTAHPPQAATPGSRSP